MLTMVFYSNQSPRSFGGWYLVALKCFNFGPIYENCLNKHLHSFFISYYNYDFFIIMYNRQGLNF